MKSIDCIHRVFIQRLLDKTNNNKYTWNLVENQSNKYETVIKDNTKQTIRFYKSIDCNQECFVLELVEDGKIVYSVRWHENNLCIDDLELLNKLYYTIGNNDKLYLFLSEILTMN